MNNSKKSIANPYAEVRFPYVPLDAQIKEQINQIKRRKKYRIFVTLDKNGTITETAHAYMFHYAGTIAITALKTIYAKEPYDYIYQLLEATKRAHASMEQSLAMNQYIDNKTVFAVVQKKSVKRFKLVKLGAKRYRVPIIPEEKLVLTEYGKQHFKSAEDNTIDDSNGLDIIHECYASLLEWANKGVITDFDSVYNCRPLVYKDINKYIRKQQNKRTDNELYFTFFGGTDKDGNEREETIKDSRADRYFKDIEESDVRQKVFAYLESHLPKNSNKAQIMFVLNEIVVNGRTQAEVAELLHLSRKTVTHYKHILEKIVSNASVNQLVHDMINGNV